MQFAKDKEKLDQCLVVVLTFIYMIDHIKMKMDAISIFQLLLVVSEINFVEQEQSKQLENQLR